MSLTDEERKVIVNLEIVKSEKTFQEFDVLYKMELWSSAANRLYYSLFHALSALLVFDGYNVKSHRGLMALFGQYYIKSGTFDKEDGRLLSDLVIMRDNADYNCFYEVDEEKLYPYITPTRQLIEKIKSYIKGKDI